MGESKQVWEGMLLYARGDGQGRWWNAVESKSLTDLSQKYGILTFIFLKEPNRHLIQATVLQESKR